jgi:hypothetical protein
MVSILPTLIQYSTGIPIQSSKTGERNKRDSNGEGRSEIVPIIDDMVPKGPKNSTKNFLDLMNTFSKVAGYKINT